MNLAHYARQLVVVSTFILVTIASVNAFIDPYFYFNVVSLEGINAQRTSLFNKRSRTAKAAVLKHCEKDVLIFGSSRAELGLREDFEEYSEQSVYNTALAGNNMSELQKVLMFAAKYQNPTTVIVGLDFESFSASRGTIADFSDSDFSEIDGGRSVPAYLRYLLSFSTLTSSWATLKSNLNNPPQFCDGKGHLNVSHQSINHRQAFTRVIVNMLVKPGAYAAFRYSDSRLQMFEDAISTIYKDQTNVFIFFSPIHARQTAVIRGLGLYEIYEQWKSDIAKAVGRIKSKSSGSGRLELWDFSGYNSITMESVPSIDEKTKMQWYRESSHYSRATGDVLVKKMLSSTQYPTDLNSDFGVRITLDKLEDHFYAQQEGAKEYEQLQANEISDVLEIIKRTEPERKRVERAMGL